MLHCIIKLSCIPEQLLEPIECGPFLRSLAAVCEDNQYSSEAILVSFEAGSSSYFRQDLCQDYGGFLVSHSLQSRKFSSQLV